MQQRPWRPLELRQATAPQRLPITTSQPPATEVYRAVPFSGRLAAGYMLESEKKKANRTEKSTSPGTVKTSASRTENGSGMAMGELDFAKISLPMS